jgi:hypothetical protein
MLVSLDFWSGSREKRASTNSLGFRMTIFDLSIYCGGPSLEILSGEKFTLFWLHLTLDGTYFELCNWVLHNSFKEPEELPMLYDYRGEQIEFVVDPKTPYDLPTIFH